MAKTGDGRSLGTAEGAVMGRAAHALHADRPILDDTWAVWLLDPATQALVRDPGYAAKPIEWDEFDVAPLFALNVGSLRYAEDEVERCVRDGVDQYVILGAGFDTFALRRGDLCDRLQVYEVDHPDVQALKRERIAAANAIPDSMPTFVPVDFESTSLTEGLEAIGLKREEVYIANIVKCRPPGNRDPERDEIETCSPFLAAQIDAIRPDVIVTLGGPATKTLLATKVGITRLRGQWKSYRGIPVMPTFHPAYVLRNYTPEIRRRVWEDLKNARAKTR